MSATLLTLAAVLVAQAGKQPASPQPPVSVQRFIVPRASVSAILGEVFSPGDPVHIRNYDEFEKLLERYQERQRRLRPAEPNLCRLNAVFDPQTLQLTGQGVIETSFGGQADMLLSPWNLAVRSGPNADEPDALDDAGDADDTDEAANWGIDHNGDLQVKAAPDGRFTFEWMQSPSVIAGRQYRFDLRTPSCGVAYLDLKLPAGWGVRTSYRLVKQTDSADSYRIFFDGAPGLSLDVLPAAMLENPQTVVTWQSHQVLRFDESSTDVEINVRLESLHEPTPKITFLLDRALQPVEDNVPVQRWLREESGGPEVRWTAEFRRPQLGRFDIAFKATFPAAPGGFFHPLLVYVEGGLARGETLDFSIGGALRIVELDTGSYQSTFTGVDQDGRYHVELKGPGSIRTDVGAMLLSANEVADWPAFVGELRRQATGAENTAAARLLRQFEDDLQQSILNADQQWNPTLQRQLLDAINQRMTSAELFDLPSLSGRVADNQAQALLARIGEGLSAAQIAWANRTVIESFLGSQLRTSVAVARPPTIRLMTGRPDVDLTLRSVLRLQRDQVWLTADMTWRCHQGTLYQPQVHIPRGWEVSSVRRINASEPPPAPELVEHLLPFTQSGREIQYRLEPTKGGDFLLWLELEQWLGGPNDPSAGPTELSIRITAHPQEAIAFGGQSPLVLAPPEIRPVGFPFARPSLYTIVVEADVPCSLQKLPLTKLDPVPAPPLVEEEGELHCFEYESPLAIEALQLTPRPPRFAAVHQQRWEWDGTAWLASLSVDIAFQQGSVGHFDLETTQPLPEDIRWTLDAPNNRVTMSKLPSEAADLHRYRLHLEVPVRRTTRLSTTWRTSASSLQAPLLQVLEADRFRGDVQVRSQTGQVIEVDPTLLSHAETPQSLVTPSADWLLYSGSYIQLRPELQLRLAVTSPAVAFQKHKGSAYLHYYSSVKQDRVVEHLFAWLDCKKPCPLEILLPGDYHLWNVIVDGQSIQPWTADGSVRLPEELSAGMHALEVIYSHSLAERWLMRRIEVPLPLPDWQVESLIHEIEYPGDGLMIPGDHLQLVSTLRFEDAEPRLLARGNIDSADADALISNLNNSYARLSELQRQDLPSMLIELQQSLAGVPLAVDEPIVSRSERRVSRQSPTPVSLSNWLAERDLTLTVTPYCCVLTSRVIHGAVQGDCSRASLDSWLEKLGLSLRQRGVDPTGRFMTPVTFALRLESRAITGSSPLMNHRCGGNPCELWTLVSQDGSNVKRLSATLVSFSGLQRVTYLTSAVVFIALLLLISKVPLRWLQVGTIALLAVLVGLALLGGPLDRFIGVPGWIGALVLLGGIFLRSQQAAAAATILTVFFIAGPNAMAAEMPAEPTHRVVVPIDPEGPKQVVVPQSLIQLLEQPPAAQNLRFLLRSARYEGEMQPDQQVRWQATLVGFADPAAAYPATASLGFNDIGVDAVRVNGMAVERFRPAGGVAALEVQLNQPGVQTIEVDFRTPLLGSIHDRELSFRIPACADNSFRLDLGDQPVTGLRSGVPGAIETQTVENSTTVTGSLGYARQFQLRWHARPADAEQEPKFDVLSAHLLDIREDVRDLLSIFRIQLKQGEIKQLQWALSGNVVVRRVDVENDNLANWEVKQQPDGTQNLFLTLLTPQSRTVDVDIQSMVRFDRQGIVEYPELRLLNASSDQGMLGLLTPRFWEVDESRLRNAEPATAAEFGSFWERLGAKPVMNLTLAKHYRQRPLELTLTLRPNATPLTVRQHFEVTANPATGLANMQATIDLETAAARKGTLRFKIPESFELQRVNGQDVYQWYQQKDWVVLLPMLGAGRRQKTVTIEGRWRSSPERANSAGPVSFDFAGFEWPQAESTRSSWKIASSEDWTFDPKNLVNTVQEPSSEGSALRFMSTTQRHAFRLVLEPVIPEAIVRSDLAVTAANEQLVFEGRLELSFRRGKRRRFQILIPKQLEVVQWQSPMVSDPVSAPKGDLRQWSVEPEVENGAPVRIDWRVVQPMHAVMYPEVPHVAIDGFEINQQRVAFFAPAGTITPILVQKMQQVPFPEETLGWPLDRLRAAADRSVQLFEAETDDWRLQFGKDRTELTQPQLSVRHVESDVAVAEDGSVQAVSRWEVLSETGGVLTVSLPEGCQPNDLWLDGRPVRFPSVEQQTLRFPIQSRNAWQSVSLYWTTPPDRLPARLKLPMLRSDLVSDIPHALVRLRLPAGASLAHSPTSMSRTDWSLARLNFLLTRLTEGLESWRRSEKDAYFKAVALEQLVRWRSELLALQERRHLQPASVNDPEGQKAALEELLEDFDEQIKRFAAQSLVDEAQRRPLIPSEPNQVLAWTLSADSHFLSLAPDSEIHIQSAVSWWQKTIDAVDWVWVVSGLLGIVVLATPGAAGLIRQFWPAVCLPLSVLWFRWSQSPELGLLLAAVSLVLAGWMVRRWFLDPDSLAAGASVSTVLKQDLSRFAGQSSDIGMES